MGYKGKRFLDVTISLFLLIILSPIFLLIALIMWIFYGSPVIHRRKVIGFKGKPFFMFKFRSMINGDPDDEMEIYEQAGYEKPIRDPRVTPIGRILRKTSLNELPQLINVIKGQMSLVGPRPRPLWMTERLSASRREIYSSIRPGITGFVRITNRSLNPLSPEHGRLELIYLEKCSLFFDLKILLKSILVVISCRGAR